MSNQTPTQFNDAWYAAQIRNLGSALSAWFALECGLRAARAFTEREFWSPVLGDLQLFLLGRSTWYELESVRDEIDARIWSTKRNDMLTRFALSAMRSATFPDEPVQHTHAAQQARKLDVRSAKPLTPGLKEASRQQQRLEDYAAYKNSHAIQDLQRAYRQRRELVLLGMLADALQDEGFAPPL